MVVGTGRSGLGLDETCGSRVLLQVSRSGPQVYAIMLHGHIGAAERTYGLGLPIRGGVPTHAPPKSQAPRVSRVRPCHRRDRAHNADMLIVTFAKGPCATFLVATYLHLPPPKACVNPLPLGYTRAPSTTRSTEVPSGFLPKPSE